MIHAVEPDRVQAGVAEKNFQAGLGRGIVLHHVGYVFANLREQRHGSARMDQLSVIRGHGPVITESYQAGSTAVGICSAVSRSS